MNFFTRFGIVCTLAGFLVTPHGVSESPVAFCDLMKDPQKYDGKEVTVRATWRYGFEWSDLYCIDCSPRNNLTWLKFSDDLDEGSEKALKHTPKGAAIVNLTIVGTFRSSGRFGHMGSYPYEFLATKVSRIKVVLKGMKGSEEEERAEKRWACGGTNPK